VSVGIETNERKRQTKEQVMSSGVSNLQHIRGHDRYLIYKLLHHTVTFTNVLRRPHKTVTGRVSSVCRNIFLNEIEVTIEGKVYRFKEPQAILLQKTGQLEEIVFVYGLNDREPTDAVLFRQIRNSQYKETIHDAMRNLTPETRKEIRFQLGQKVQRRG